MRKIAKAMASSGFILLSFFALADESCNSVACEDTEEISRPMVTNTTVESFDLSADFFSNPYRISLFNPKHGENADRVWSQTKSVFGYGLGVAAFLYAMPEDFTNWDKDGEVLGKWGDNVKEVAVWDRDVWYINYIGHPYFGGVYYQIARKSGYRQWDSFIYSAMMSTFYWEYGVEAFAERPSLQDLIATPVGGWLFGEWMYQKEMDIRANGKRVWGSEGWGSVALFLLDPVDSIGTGVNSLFDRQVVKAGTGYINIGEVALNRQGDSENRVTFGMSFMLGDGSRDYRTLDSVPAYTSLTGDPVDYSMISLGFGLGYVFLDDVWQLDDNFTAGFEIGMHFGRRFSTHLSFARGYLDDEVSGENIPYENYSLNAQYYFNTDENIRPFVVLGLGKQLRDQDRDLDAFVVQAGLGLYYKMSDNWAFQADGRAYHSTRFDSTDYTTNILFMYRFGRGEWY